MINATDILLIGDYYVFYSFDRESGQSYIGFSRSPDDEIAMEYRDGVFSVMQHTKSLYYDISAEAVLGFIHVFLNNYADLLNYPTDYIIYLVDNVRTTQIYYNVKASTNQEKRDLFLEIAKEIYIGGLNKAHIDLCQEHGMMKDLQELTKFMLGIEIKATNNV